MTPKNTYYDIVIAAAGTLMYYVIFDAIALASTLILSTCLISPAINYMECHSQSAGNNDSGSSSSGSKYPAALVNMFSLTFLITFSLFFLLVPQTPASVNIKTRGSRIGYALVALTAVFICIHFLRSLVTRDGNLRLLTVFSFFGLLAALLFAGLSYSYQVANFHIDGFTSPSASPMTTLGDIKYYNYASKQSMLLLNHL